jgi:hypothetical protein
MEQAHIRELARIKRSFGEEVEGLYEMLSDSSRQLTDVIGQSEMMKQAFMEYGRQFEMHLNASEDRARQLALDNQAIINEA